MRDIGNDETEVLLAEIEKRIGREYKRAAEDIEEKLNDYWRRFQIKDEAWQRMVANGKKTKQQYQAWRTGQLMVGDRWEGMKKTIADDLHNANVIAKGIVNGNLAEVYAANHNFTTFDIEKAAGVNTSFTLVDRDTVNRIIRDNPELLPPPSATLQKEFADFDAYKAGKSVDLSEEKRKAFDKLIADNKDIRWQEGKIQSVTLQSILQGESIPNMAKRIAQELGETNHKSTIRYARTAVTGAQNAGKEDAYRRAEAHGCKMKRVWRAVHDNRTRHEHRVLDGQIRGIDEPFEIDGYKIDFPADPKLAREAPYLYWNCRCGTRALIDGLEPQAVKYREIEGMTYEEWKNAKPKSRSITHQEEVAEGMKWRTIHDLYGGTGGGSNPTKAAVAPVNVFGETIKWGAQFEDAKWNQAKEMVDTLASTYKTKLKEVRIGAHKAAGSVQISGTVMNLSNAKPNTIVHEFAHTISMRNQTKFGLYDESEFWKEIQSVRTKYMRSVGNDSAKWISTYEHSNKEIDEFFAEAFTQAQLVEMGYDLPQNYGKDITYSSMVLEIVKRYFGK